MNRETVRDLQRYLRRIAQADDRIPVISVDGIYGAETAQAVQAFQQAYGLPASGQADRLTWQALLEVYRAVREYDERGIGVTVLQNGQQQLGEGSDAAQVYVLQAILQQLYGRGYLPQAVPIDGVYGAETKRAVEHIRRIGNLPQGDTVDRAAWDVIARLYNAQPIGGG